MLLRIARRKGCAIFVWRTLPPAISREDNSSYCSIQSLSRGFAGVHFCRELEAPAIYLSFSIDLSIHSDEAERERVSSARAKSWLKVVRPALCDEASAAMQEQPLKSCSCSATHFVAKTVTVQDTATVFGAVLRNIAFVITPNLQRIFSSTYYRKKNPHEKMPG